MTHEELLYRMNWASERYHDTDGRAQYFDALRAVVELHKPMGLPWGVTELGCEGCGNMYPCKTIKTIQNQLN